MKFFTELAWGQWFHGLIAAMIGGGSSAVSGGIVLNVQDAKDYNFGDARLYKVMAWMFCVNGLLSMFFFLKQHPVPDRITTTVTETTVSRVDPTTVVTTKVEEVKETTTKHEEQKP